MTSTPPTVGQDIASPVALGLQLRVGRKRSGLTLRELARRIGVSPSLLSQVENGKSQPSVATLYALAKALDLSIDHLFEVQADGGGAVETTDEPTEALGIRVDDAVLDQLHHSSAVARPGDGPGLAANRTEVGPQHHVWNSSAVADRLSTTRPDTRTRLVMDTGVIWEQLASNTGHQLDFMEITYPPGSCSTSDERMLQHDGFEYGYVLEGELEITLGFDVFTLRAGEAVGLNSSIPHLLRNQGSVPARGIWFVHHRHD